jgi:hypothetical protein
MSAFPQKRTKQQAGLYVRFVPQGDICTCSKSRLIGSRSHLEIAVRRGRGCGPARPDGYTISDGGFGSKTVDLG